jgi:uncharacterized membrane protein
MKGLRPIWVLIGILLLGALLRLWNLAAKPLWMDETITALFSYGRSYLEVPYGQALPVSAFEQLLRLNGDATCAQISTTVAVQSVHPPLFFCWLHQWLVAIQGFSNFGVWNLRLFPALIGVGAIAAAYMLNRALFSTQAGLASAALMAVSPFAVYLSQEARHYSLPMLLILLALLGLYRVLQNLHQPQIRPGVWIGWILVNSVGFYVHYFFLLALIAQAAILLLEVKRCTQSPTRLSPTRLSPFRFSHPLFVPLLSLTTISLTYLPWLPTFMGHIGRSETDWMNMDVSNGLRAIAPLYQLATGWMVMVIALPVEQQPWWIALPCVLVMVFFAGWLAKRAIASIQVLWRIPETHLATRMLVYFTSFVVLEFLAIAYIMGKDLTQVPRYNFIYFPAVCALLGATFSQVRLSAVSAQSVPAAAVSFVEGDRRSRDLAGNTQPPRSRILRLSPRVKGHSSKLNVAASLPSLPPVLPSIWLVVLVGVLSCCCVVNNLTFQKPYNPEQVAQHLAIDPTVPSLVISAYEDFQDVALGLSFAIGLHQFQLQQPAAPRYFAFLEQRQGYGSVWQALSTLTPPAAFPLNLWVIAPGLKRVGYPQQLTLGDRSSQPHSCQIDPNHHHRLGVPYQLYRCP